MDLPGALLDVCETPEWGDRNVICNAADLWCNQPEPTGVLASPTYQRYACAI